MFKKRESGKTTSQMLDEIRNQVASSAQVTPFPTSDIAKMAGNINEQVKKNIVESDDDSDLLESVLLNDADDFKNTNNSDDDEDLIELDSDNSGEEENLTENSQQDQINNDDDDLIEASDEEDENLDDDLIENSDEEDQSVNFNEDIDEEDDLLMNQNSNDTIDEETIENNSSETTLKTEQPKPEIRNENLANASFINPIYRPKQEAIQTSNLPKENSLQKEQSTVESFINESTNNSISKLMDIVKKQAGKLVVEKNQGSISLEEFAMAAIAPKLDQYISNFMRDNLSRIVEEKVQSIVENEIKKIIDNSN